MASSCSHGSRQVLATQVVVVVVVGRERFDSSGRPGDRLIAALAEESSLHEG